MKDKILILGYFGFESNKLDGQTIKTRNVYNLLLSKKDEIGNVDYFDTEVFRKNKLNLIKLFRKIASSNKVVYLPANNNLKYIFPFLFIISRIRKISIIYCVIGGWLYEFLLNKAIHTWMLKRIDVILIENQSILAKLRDKLYFKNVVYLPNFRNHDFVVIPKTSQGQLKIVFMARVTREKGIDVLFEIADLIDAKKNYPDIIIDIYGPIDNNDAEYFNDELPRHANVSYKGIIEPDNVNIVLSRYDLMILPTRYSGEGFPGSILDAYISGIPVLTTKWKHIPEFIDEGNTGFTVDVHDSSTFFKYIELLDNDRNLLHKMKLLSLEKSKEFTPEIAWNILKVYF